MAPDPLGFLSGGGEMGSRIRDYPWARHPLGPPRTWPQSLRSMVGLMLSTRQPVFIFWGSEQYCFYNDAYSESIGPEKHPSILGAKGRDAWPEIWHIIGPQIEQVLSGRGATWHEDQLVPIIRNGGLEDVYWTYSYSPIDDDGHIGGVLVLCRETTRQVLSERRERETVARLQELFDRSPGFVAVLSGADHRFEFANGAYRLLIGNRDIIGRTVADVLPEAAGQGFVELLDRVYRSGESFSGRAVPIMLRNQADAEPQEHFLDFVYQPLRDVSGAISGIFVEGYDVSEHVILANALRRSDQRFRVAVDAIEGTLWTADAAGRMRGEQPGWARLTGQSLADYQDFGWAQAVHPDDRQASIASWKAAVARREPYMFEHRVKPAGLEEWRHFVIRAIPVFADSGEIAEWVGVNTDVTEQQRAHAILEDSRKQLEIAVAERTADLIDSEARMRTILATSHMLLGLVSRDGYLLEANAASFKGGGLEPQATIGKLFWQTPWFVSSAEAQGIVKDAFHRVVGTGVPVAMTLILVLGGEERTFDFSMRPVIDNTGHVTAVVPEAIDITERLATETALRQSQKLDVLGQLTGGITHEFKNLLTAMTGGLNRLERDLDREQRNKTIDLMRGAIARGTQFSEQLLAVARRPELKTEILHLPKFLADLSALLGRSIGQGAIIELDVDPNTPPIEVDHGAFQQALLNLVVNARDAMPSGGKITISAYPCASQTHRLPAVHVSVADSGVGIPMDIQKKVFEPFFTTKEPGKGTGLGLAQVQTFVRSSRGTIEIESEAGRGTTFIMIFPQASDNDDA